MDNYIGKIDAEWVDPAVELPPVGWRGLIMQDSVDPLAWSCFDDRGWWPKPVIYQPVAWLRIGGPSTDVPRAAVQAAVDEIYLSTQYRSNLIWALSAIREHTGIVPTVTP